MARSHTGTRPGILLLALLLAAACDRGAPLELDPAFAKGPKSAGDPKVSAVDPGFGKQGESIAAVRITGSSFTAGAVAAWERNGVPDPHITVLATRYISSTELQADIAIAPDADLAFYDVSVTLVGGKRGVGIEKFEVTTAQVIEPLCSNANSVARGVNDLGQVVGQSCGYAFYWEDGQATVNLGTGIATDIGAAGTAIVGASWGSATTASEGPALLWLRSGTGWVRTELPSTGYTARANAIASDAGGVPSIIAGQYKVPVNKRTSTIRPAVWLPSSGGWVLQPLPLPADASASTSVRVLDVNGAGAAVGGTTTAALLWERAAAGTYTVSVLPGGGEANGISPTGDLVVGSANGVAAYWHRSGGVWYGPTSLTACSGTAQTWANTVTADGLIGGRGCDGATVWRVGTTVAETRLPGLGSRDANQEVWAASASRLVGSAVGSAVYWANLF